MGLPEADEVGICRVKHNEQGPLKANEKTDTLHVYTC